MPDETTNPFGGHGGLPKSGDISVGNASGDSKSINIAKDKSTTGATPHNAANTSLRTLHDWFYSNAFIHKSDATGTGQTNVKMSEFHEAQVLTADFHGHPETPTTYSTANNTSVRIRGHINTFIPDSGGDRLYYFSGDGGAGYTLQTNNHYMSIGTGSHGTKSAWIKDGVSGRIIKQDVWTGFGGGETHYWNIQERANNPN